MRYASSVVTAVAACAALVLGHPIEIEERAYPVAKDFGAPPGGDITILNYALTLEYLERAFYREGITKFTEDQFVDAGFPAPFYSNLKTIYFDEKTHVDFLAGALGTAAVKEASYKFPFTDPKSFVALSSVLEGVGVSAYLGAAAAIMEKSYLTVAGSILTVESRHSSYIRAALGEKPFPKPFDTPLDFNQVYSLAAQFITGFKADSPPLPFVAFPPLSVKPSKFVAGSSSVTFTNAFKNAVEKKLVKDDETPVYAVFFSGLDVYYVPCEVTEGDKDYKVDEIPEGVEGKQLPATGQVYIVLSTADGSKTKVSDENTISGVGLIEVLPPRDNYEE